MPFRQDPAWARVSVCIIAASIAPARHQGRRFTRSSRSEAIFSSRMYHLLLASKFFTFSRDGSVIDANARDCKCRANKWLCFSLLIFINCRSASAINLGISVRKKKKKIETNNPIRAQNRSLRRMSYLYLQVLSFFFSFFFYASSRTMRVAVCITKKLMSTPQTKDIT